MYRLYSLKVKASELIIEYAPLTTEISGLLTMTQLKKAKSKEKVMIGKSKERVMIGKSKPPQIISFTNFSRTSDL